MLKNGLFALTTLLCCGCGVAVGEDESDSPESPKVGQTTQALDTEPPFQRSVGSNSNIEVVSAASHFCFLSGVWGVFDSWENGVNTYINANQNWSLQTASGQSGQVTCAGKNWFQSYFGGTERSVSGVREAFAWAGGVCDNDNATLLSGQAASFLTHMNGSFRGGGEAIWIDQAPSGSAFSTLFARDCQDDGAGRVLGQARSYFVGDWAFAGFGCSAFFWRNAQPFGEPVSGFDITPYGVNNPGTGGDEFTLMSNVSDSVCALTKVTGKFSGGCEYAWISPDGPRWKLRVRACAGRAVYAEARCFARGQC